MSLQQWQQFLQDSAKEYPMTNTSLDDTVICDLSHLGLLKISGDDAFTFLQGQVTNDVKKLDGKHAHFTGYCNPKGRLLALFLAFAQHEHLYLQMPKELTEAIAKRLKMYVMRSKVEIKDASDSIIKFGLSGKNASSLLNALFAQVPHHHFDLVTLENVAILKLPSETPRFEIFTDSSHAAQIWNALLKEAKPVLPTHWDRLEIAAGIPEVYISTQEAFVPQMLNLDLIDGINFKKGCYTGQEIVARTHYLGSIKRRTHLGHLIANIQHPPSVGDDILNHHNEIVGKVVRVTTSLAVGYDILAEIRLESFKEDCYVHGNLLKIQQLPYSL